MKEEKNINYAHTLLIILTIVFIVSVSVIIWVNYSKKSKPESTTVPVGSFAVNPGITATSSYPIVSVNNLQVASNRCLADRECKSFIYDEGAKTFQIVDLTSPKSKDNSKNLYTLQVGIKYNL